MTDWRADHQQEIVAKQRHISQKLAQLREFRELVLKWKRDLRRLRDWFASLESAASGSNWFSVGSLIRMNSIIGSLQQMIGEFEQVGDPKATGTGTSTATGQGPDAGQIADWLTSRAGPLASSAPWELIPTFDPATAESVRKGDYGAAAANAIFSPYTSLSAVGFAEATLDLSLELIREHESEFDDLESGWKDAVDGLDRILTALDAIDHQELRDLESELHGTLSGYERTYEDALGTGPPTTELREVAEGRRTMSDFEYDEWNRRLVLRTEELDRMLEETNDYDPDTDPDLAGLDDLPGVDD